MAKKLVFIVLGVIMIGLLKNLLMPALPAFAKTVTADEAVQMMKDNTELFVLDVRTEKEYAEKHYPQAVLIPVSELQGRMHEIPENKDVLIYCHSGNRARAAVKLFEESPNRTVYVLDGFPKF